MGICISSASSEIHQADDGLENVMHVQEDIISHGIEKRGSLYSKEGSKGVNQDAAVVHQVGSCYLFFTRFHPLLFEVLLLIGTCSSYEGLWNGTWSFLWSF
jgi:hypothetical protein